MINWQYNPENYGKIKPIAPGEYRVRIENAEEQTSKTGRDMIKMTLKVSGQEKNIFHYFVFLAEYPEMTDDKLGRIFDSFGITPSDLNLEHWKGRVGAAEIINETDNQGNLRERVKNFIKRNDQGRLSPWQEHAPKNNVNPNMLNPDNDDTVPF